MEVLSVDPPIFHVTEFLTADEVDEVIKAAKTAIRIGRVQSHNTTLERSQSTTLDQRRGLSKKLSLRALSLSRFIPAKEYKKLVEPIQVVHYTKEGGHGCHMDTGDFADPINRMITISIVLKQPKAGGKMVFPGAEMKEQGSYRQFRTMQEECEPVHKCTSTRTGISTLPKVGDAIMWYNMDAPRIKEKKKKEEPKKRKNSDLMGDMRDEEETPMPTFKIPRHTPLMNAFHCDAEVTDGEKWMSNIYLNLTPDRKPGGKKKKSDTRTSGTRKRKVKRKKRRLKQKKRGL